MKKTLFLISLFITLNIFSQTNFTHSNSLLTWQQVFNNDIGTTDLNLALKKLGFNCGISGEIIEFDKNYSLDNLKKHGYSWGSFPTYMNDGNFQGFIEFKEGKFRVTITSIKIINTLNPNLLDELETWTYRKDKMKMPTASEKVLNTFNSYFTEIFTLTAEKSDW